MKTSPLMVNVYFGLNKTGLIELVLILYLIL